MSNSSELMELLPESERIIGRDFGVVWNHQNDILQIGDVRFNEQQSVVITKQGVLKAIAGIFDPLGLVTPVTFHGKVFIQELWKEDINMGRVIARDIVSEMEKHFTEVEITFIAGSTPFHWQHQRFRLL